MRFAPILLALSLLLAACSRHDEPKPLTGDAKLQQKLVGKWSLHLDKDWSGQTFESTVTVVSNGAYACEITTTGSLGVQKFTIEGTMEVKDGFIIDTMLKHSSTNFTHTSVSRARIIRFDNDQLIVKYVKYDEADFEAVFRRVRK